MSWLTKAFPGLPNINLLGNASPEVKTELNAIGDTIIHGIEASSPTAQALVDVLDTLQKDSLVTTASAISAAGTVVAILDPTFVQDIEGAVHKVVTKLGLTVAEHELDALLVAELMEIGLIKHA